MKPKRATVMLGVAAALIVGWGGRAADLGTNLQTAFMLRTAPAPVSIDAAASPQGAGTRALAPATTPRVTAAILSPALHDGPNPIDPAASGFRGQVQVAGFDLDLAKLYRGREPSVAAIDLASNAARRSRADPTFATWDLPMTITPADRRLASELQQRADTALATQVAVGFTPARAE